MKTISQLELIGKLADRKGAVICGLLTLTDAKAKKTGNPYGTIYKLVRSVGFCGANYQAAVEREAIRQNTETNFQSENLPWGKWEVFGKVISHSGEWYLRTESTPNQRQIQSARVLAYLDAAGNVLDREKIKQFLPVARESAKQQAAGLNKTIFVRTYKFNSILKIRIFGETYGVAKPAQVDIVKQVKKIYQSTNLPQVA